MPKLLYVLLDGVGDRPHPSLGGRTPLEAARTPALDSLAANGVSGQVYTVGRGIAPESDIAVFSMLGYSFGEDYPGRGVIEAVGAGVDFKPGDVALRANFATVDEEMNIVDRRAGRNLSDDEGRRLAGAITKSLKLSRRNASFTFVHTVAHRAVLSFRADGTPLSGSISNTDPAYAKVRGMGVAKEKVAKARPLLCVPLDETEGARVAALLVNEFTEKSHEILEKDEVNALRKSKGFKPANMILCRDAGNALPNIQTLEQKFGRRFAAVADMPVELGIGSLTGMKVFTSGGVFDYAAKCERVFDLLRKYDVVYLHIKGPDEPGHDGDAVRKAKIIEGIDSGFFAPLVSSRITDDVVVAVSADHSTPCLLKAHSDDPVPLLLSGSGVRGDGTRRFTEQESKTGSLGTLLGVQVLPIAIRYAFG